MSPLRVGIIGCGNVLSAYRTPLDRLRICGDVAVTALCGRDSQRSQALAWFPGARFVVDPSQLIGSPDVDIVMVLTSMPQHAALGEAALKAGHHVLLEKPLAIRMEDADRLVELAKTSPGWLVCAPFTLLSPTFQIMARHLRSGDIGRTCSARARYGWAGPWWNEWFYQPGGGCLFDLAVYSITSLTGLLGPARRVMAMTGVAIPQREINGKTIDVQAEDNAQVLLDFGQASFAVVTSGFTLQQYRNPALEIYGTTGAIQMLGDDWDPDGYELWKNSAGAWQVFKETAPEWSWTDGLNHLVQCIREAREPILRPEHARHVLEIMLAAQESGRTGRSVDLTTTFETIASLESGSQEVAHLMHDRSRDHGTNQ